MRWYAVTGVYIAPIAALTWSQAQHCLILSLVFPGIARWAGISPVGLALTMILSALLSRAEFPGLPGHRVGRWDSAR